MKNITKLFFALIMTSATLISCDPADQYKTEITEMDSCLVKLDSLETLFDGIEFDSLNMMLEHVLKNEEVIKQIYSPDTVNEDFGRKMNDSKAIRKRLKNIGKDQITYGDELNAVKHQFIDLKEDVTEGVLSDEQVKEYLNVEKAALSKVSLAFEGFYQMQKEEKYRYYQVVPEIFEFIENLKKELEAVE